MLYTDLNVLIHKFIYKYLHIYIHKCMCMYLLFWISAQREFFQVLHLADNAFKDFPAIMCFGDAGHVIEEKKGVGFDVSDLGIDEYEVRCVVFLVV